MLGGLLISAVISFLAQRIALVLGVGQIIAKRYLAEMNNFFFAGNFLFRKIFSYISLGPIYINELFLFYRALAYLITLKFRIIHIFPISLALYGFAHLLSLFSQGASLDSTTLKNLPIMLYAIFSLTIFKLSDRNVLILIFSLFIIESFLILLYGSAIGITLFGDVVYPHNSAIHAAATVYFLFRFFDKNDYRILIFFLISLFFLIMEGQRTGFVNLGFCLLIIFLFTFTYRSIFTFFSMAGVLFVVMLAFNPAILEFFMSFIPGTEASRSVEYLSTNARIEQWSEVISNVTRLLDFNTIMFGLGINFEIIQEGWRNPHNGYISIILSLIHI